jgi:uncharacterized membrane protein YraQ (UPF0718 family)
MDWEDVYRAFYRASRSFAMAIPVLLGVVLFIGLFKVYVPTEAISTVFTGSALSDTFIGALLGSVSGGNAINSYILGGELLEKEVSLLAVTAFLLAWVTVGIIQLPAEAAILGRRFAVTRNLIAFFMAMIISMAVVAIMAVI